MHYLLSFRQRRNIDTVSCYRGSQNISERRKEPSKRRRGGRKGVWKDYCGIVTGFGQKLREGENGDMEGGRGGKD